MAKQPSPLERSRMTKRKAARNEKMRLQICREECIVRWRENHGTVLQRGTPVWRNRRAQDAGTLETLAASPPVMRAECCDMCRFGSLADSLRFFLIGQNSTAMTTISNLASSAGEEGEQGSSVRVQANSV